MLILNRPAPPIVIPTGTTWDANSKVRATLLNDDTMARFDQPPFYSGWGGVRSTTGKSSVGRWLCQVKMSHSMGSGINSYPIFGIASALVDLGVSMSGSPQVVGWQPDGAHTSTGNVRGLYSYTKSMPWAGGNVFDIAMWIANPGWGGGTAVWFRNRTQESQWTATFDGDMGGTPDSFNTGFFHANWAISPPIHIQTSSIGRNGVADWSIEMTIIPNGGTKPPGATTYEWWDS